MKKSDQERIRKILSLWNSLDHQIKQHNITKELLLTDEFTQWAVTTPLYNIGEQVYQISSNLKDQYPNIPWSVVSGLRHRLVHEYEGINWSIISSVVFDEMADFIKQISEVNDSLQS